MSKEDLEQENVISEAPEWMYRFYNKAEIGMINRFPDLGGAIAKYGEALSYIPGPIGAAGGIAVFATKLAQGKEREAYAALFVALTALVGGGAITKILSRAALGGTSMTAAIKIVNRIPAPIVRLGGGAQKMTVKLAKYLPWITQAGINQVENEVNAAGEVIESVKDRGGFSKKPQKFRMRTLPDPELKAKKVAEAAPLDEKKRKSEAVLEAVLTRLLQDKNV